MRRKSANRGPPKKDSFWITPRGLFNQIISCLAFACTLAQFPTSSHISLANWPTEKGSCCYPANR